MRRTKKMLILIIFLSFAYLNDSMGIDGLLDFQACDDTACTPVRIDLLYEFEKADDSKIIIKDLNKRSQFNDYWGELTILGFDKSEYIEGQNLQFHLNFNIKDSYHIFSADPNLCPLGTGNTDIYWNDESWFNEQKSIEPNPIIAFNETYRENLGYHYGKLSIIKEYITIDSNSSVKTNNVSSEGLLSFFLGSLLAGLAAIFTPCVFPMIPLTVSFFTNKSKSKKNPYSAPILYGLSIILIFIALGVLFAALLGASALNVLATSAAANVLFFIIFFVFALSFFGAFDLALPSSFLNLINKKADQGGIIGIFFMAFTLVLITFSCTAPIVGSVLILSSDGQLLKPIVGMFGFSLSFAFIFSVTAMFPKGLESLPKGNLNVVKVFIGFIELAFSLKFLSKADLTNQWGILNREIYLALWIIIFTLLGFYLLGKIRLYHDNKEENIGVIRLLLATISLSFVVTIVPGMFGAPLSWLSGYLPPPSTQEFDVMKRFDDIESAKYYEGFPSQIKYQHLKNFELPLGLKGFFDYEEALSFSKNNNKPLFLDFTGFACENCRQMEHNVWSKPHIQKLLKEELIVVSLFVDSRHKLAEPDWVYNNEEKPLKYLGLKNLDIAIKKYGNPAQPLYVIIDSEENILSGPIGYCSEDDFYTFLKSGIEIHKNK